MIIPYESLANEVLTRLLEEIVTRDGTDYGLVETATSEKIDAALMKLKQGKSVLLWEEETESASLVSKEYAEKLGFGKA
jgi:uncharacterized protein